MKSNTGLAFLAGAAVGALAILFLPDEKRIKARKAVASKATAIQNQLEKIANEEHVQQIYGKLSVEAQKAYTKASKELANMVGQLKEVDEGKYADLVDAVIDNAKKGGKLTADQLAKVKKEFMSFYEIDTKPAKKS